MAVNCFFCGDGGIFMHRCNERQGMGSGAESVWVGGGAGAGM